MFLGRGARLSGRVFHNGKGRPHTSTVFNKNLSYHTPRSFAPLRQHSTPIRPLSRSWQSPRILSHQSLRFASNTPIVPAAQLTETSTQTSVTGATDSAASSADAWADTLKDFPSVDYAKLEPHFGYLKEMGLDFGWGPTAFVEWMLEHVHVISGLPWAGSIAITALIVRFGLLKLFINASDTSARMATIQPLLQPIQEEIKVAKARQDSQTMVDAASRLRGVYRSANISFAALFLPMVAQGALGVGSFRLLRNMAELPVPGFDQGGFLWLTDLTYPDPLYLLPAITTGIVFWTMKRGGETGQMTTVNPNTLKFMQYGLPSLMGIWLLFMPGALQLTIFVSSLFAFFQSSLLRNEKVRHWLNIQSLPRPSPTDPAFADVHASTMTRYEAPRLPTAVDPTAKTVETKTSEIKSMYRKLVDNLPGKAQVEEQMEKAKTKNQIAEVRAFEKQFREKKVAKAIKEKWNVKR